MNLRILEGGVDQRVHQRTGSCSKEAKRTLRRAFFTHLHTLKQPHAHRARGKFSITARAKQSPGRDVPCRSGTAFPPRFENVPPFLALHVLSHLLDNRGCQPHDQKVTLKQTVKVSSMKSPNYGKVAGKPLENEKVGLGTTVECARKGDWSGILQD